MNEIRIYGPIGNYPAFSAKELAESIPANAKKITVRINSPGGSVADGIAIYNYLRDHPAKVTTIVDGFAASAASLVMLAGDVRQVHSGSVVMVHNPWTAAVGNAGDLRQTATALDEITAAMMEIYSRRTGKNQDELAALFEAETYMRGSTAMAMGFADEMIDAPESTQMAATADFLAICRQAQEYKMATKQEKIDIEARVQELETANAEANAALAAATENASAIAESFNSVSAELETVKQTLAERDELLATANSEAADMRAQIAELTAERDNAKNALANPATVDAAMLPAGAKPGISDAEADRLDEEAKAKADQEKPSLWDAYNSLESAEQKTAFWKANSKAMQAELTATKSN
jgi:ATP-dependent Clp endopeptidase proteolytic subunit ClpP